MGKAKAMDMALTGRMMDATEAERSGLVSRVVPLDKLMEEALGAALVIRGFSQIAVMAAKEKFKIPLKTGQANNRTTTSSSCPTGPTPMPMKVP